MFNPILIYKTRFIEQKSDDSYNLDFLQNFLRYISCKYSVASSVSTGGSDGTVASGNRTSYIS